MSLPLLLFIGFVATLLLAFAWALRRPHERRKLWGVSRSLDEDDRQHVTYLPQIRQALSKTDFQYLTDRAPGEVRRRVRRERRGVALAFMEALRRDFQSLLRMARVIAVLSPEVAAVQEFDRLRLTAKFTWKYQLIRWKLMAGMGTLPQLDGLGNLVSSLSVRMEEAMKELGERAALAAELASSMNRRGLDAV